MCQRNRSTYSYEAIDVGAPRMVPCDRRAVWMVSIPSEEVYACDNHLVATLKDAIAHGWTRPTVSALATNDAGITAVTADERGARATVVHPDRTLEERFAWWKTLVVDVQSLGDTTLYVTAWEFADLQRVLAEVEHWEIIRAAGSWSWSAAWGRSLSPKQSMAVVVDTSLANEQRARTAGVRAYFLDADATRDLGVLTVEPEPDRG